ncbi:MAG: 30S ribosomal protein S3ae [Halobacteria archaeon]
MKKTKRPKSSYTIMSPDFLGNLPLGETVADDPAKLVGRRIETNMAEITGDQWRQSTRVSFKIASVDGTTARTVFDGHQMARDYMRSLAKRRTSKIDAIVHLSTKDGARVVLQASGFTLRRANEPQVKAVREAMVTVLRQRAGALDLVQLVQEMVLGKLSADLYKEAKSIYPLRRVEVEKSQVN